MTSIVPPASPTKIKILDAAEKLFGRHGFDGTSLRDITAEAHVNLAAVNYHFQSKEALIDALIERRLGPINQLRIEILESLGPAPRLEAILEAFLSPVINKDVPVLLIARLLANPSEFVERVYNRHLRPTLLRFSSALTDALPGLSSDEIFWRIHFMAGSMTHVLALAEVATQMKESVTCNRKELIERMVIFLAAGFRAPGVTPTTMEKKS